MHMAVNITPEPSYFPAREEPEQDLLAELEDSMPQGVANDTALAGDTPEDQLDSLDALLAESVKHLEVEKQYKADREARKRGYQGMSKEEVEFCNSRLHAFEMAREWDADRCIAVFIGYSCAKCDSARVVFSRLMEHHQYRRNPTTSRWVTVKDSKLPAETVYDQKEVPMCPDCVGDYGMADPMGAEVPWFDEVINDREN